MLHKGVIKYYKKAPPNLEADLNKETELLVINLSQLSFLALCLYNIQSAQKRDLLYEQMLVFHRYLPRTDQTTWQQAVNFDLLSIKRILNF